jgi:hypothetical protein
VVPDKRKNVLNLLDIGHLLQATEDSAGEVASLLVIRLQRAKGLPIAYAKICSGDAAVRTTGLEVETART